MSYSYFIHGWFLVWLDEQRAAGKIHQGKSLLILTFVHLGRVEELDYEGEIDENGKACGVGQKGKYYGTFYNNQIQGLGE